MIIGVIIAFCWFDVGYIVVFFRGLVENYWYRVLGSERVLRFSMLR